MSVEKQVRRELRRMVFWRLLAAPIQLMVELCRALEHLVSVAGGFFSNISNTVFYYELDAARRYKSLTGIDMGVAAGVDERYLANSPRASVVAERDEYGEDEDDDE